MLEPSIDNDGMVSSEHCHRGWSWEASTAFEQSSWGAVSEGHMEPSVGLHLDSGEVGWGE
jgi:hypothetical protein